MKPHARLQRDSQVACGEHTDPSRWPAGSFCCAPSSQTTKIACGASIRRSATPNSHTAHITTSTTLGQISYRSPPSARTGHARDTHPRVSLRAALAAGARERDGDWGVTILAPPARTIPSSRRNSKRAVPEDEGARSGRCTMHVPAAPVSCTAASASERPGADIQFLLASGKARSRGHVARTGSLGRERMATSRAQQPRRRRRTIPNARPPQHRLRSATRTDKDRPGSARLTCGTAFLRDPNLQVQRIEQDDGAAHYRTHIPVVRQRGVVNSARNHAAASSSSS
ncbi:hypothetical protein C8F04DRAFT_1255815 [Mycena alexandri]|uniref:Uncharacterized protein n=1 Tax=Mycena alexandri TaxID=1745969 RepID=A0AAD6T698_9AGAR|nr:hypothetical protein C8F04DRAFT_1255815 [Mycena alexandri]